MRPRAVAAMAAVALLWWVLLGTPSPSLAVVGAAAAPGVRAVTTETAPLSPGQSAWVSVVWASDSTVTEWSTTVKAPAGVTVTYPTTRGGRDTSLYGSSTLVGGTKDFTAFRLAVPYSQTSSFQVTVTSTYRYGASATPSPTTSPSPTTTPSPTATTRSTPTPTATAKPTATTAPAATPTATATAKPSAAPAPVTTARPTATPTAKPAPAVDDDDDEKAVSPEATATPLPSEEPGRGGSASRSSDRDQRPARPDPGRTLTTTATITVPIRPATGPALRLATTSISLASGSNDFHTIELAAGQADLAGVSLQLGTLPRGLTVAYPGDRPRSGLNRGTALVALTTDYAAVRLIATGLAPGRYEIPVVVQYRAATAQTFTGTVTLHVS